MRLVRWGLTAVAAVLLAGVVVWVVGAQLPVEHRTAVTRIIPVDVESVWARIERVTAWPEWQAIEVEPVGEDSVRIRQQGETLVYRIERPAPRTLVTRIVSEGLPFGGQWTWTAAPTAAGATEVTIVEDGEVYDPVFRFFARFVFGHEQSLVTALDALEASFREQP